MGKTTKLTISLPVELVSLADKIAEEKKVSRSQVISACLRAEEKRRKEELLKEGYLAMAEENKRMAEMAFEAQSEAVLKNTEWK
jgi:metal-responsive CopG/Arc/MetJ family transcriptional regulator